MSSTDAVMLRKHLAETKENYQEAVKQLRRQMLEGKATQLELQLLRAGGGNGGLDGKCQQLIQYHAQALEQ
jgi:hypothetical protein